MLLLALKHMQQLKLCKSRTLSSVKVTFSKWHCSQEVIHDFPEGLRVAFLPSVGEEVAERTIRPWVLTLKWVSQIPLRKCDKLSHRKCKSTAEEEREFTFCWLHITSFKQVKFKNKFQVQEMLIHIQTVKLRNRQGSGSAFSWMMGTCH